MLDKTAPILRPEAYSYLRLSTEVQTEGDGIRRMTSGAEKVAVELGLPLNRTVSMNDLGVSAYTGENRTSGALAGFLHLVRDGRIAVGSVLIMDALDRFSREDPLDAIEPYVRVLKAGVDIYTLVDKRRHSRNVRGMAGAVQLMLSMMQFGVGNEESSKKSYRLSEVWGEKRVNAAKHRTPMTALTPGWIRLDENRQFQTIEDRAEIVVEIFEAAAAGIGKRTIAKRYADVPTWGRGKKAGHVFYESYVQKLLDDRRVLGEFQPGTKPKGGKWSKAGDVIADFYPRVVSDELWWRVRAVRTGRGKVGGGNPEAFRSLLRGLTFCGRCAAERAKPVGMEYVAKGRGARSGSDKLVCSLALRGKCDHKRRYNYARFEIAVLFGLSERAAELLGKSNERRAAMGKEIEILRKKAVLMEDEQKRWLEAISDSKTPPKAIVAKLGEIERRISEVDTEIERSEAEWRATPVYHDIGTSLRELQETLRLRQTPQERRHLNEHLRRLISRIDFIPADDGGATVVVAFRGGDVAKWFLPA